MNIELPSILFSEDVQRSLREDLGRAGDLSTLATIGVDQMADAAFVAREGGVVCGLVHAQKAFELIDPSLKFEILMPDGSIVSPGDAVARVTGRARPILFAERTVRGRQFLECEHHKNMPFDAVVVGITGLD